jgi:hypothetical protein
MLAVGKSMAFVILTYDVMYSTYMPMFDIIIC